MKDAGFRSSPSLYSSPSFRSSLSLRISHFAFRFPFLVVNALMSDHFDGRRFRNPSGRNGLGFRDVWRMLRTKRAPWPARIDVLQQRPPAPAADGETIVTFIGHSTFLLQTSAGNAITDPIFSDRASPVSFAGPRRVRAPGVSIDDLPEISLVLLSHNHYDHCDVPALRALFRRFAPRVLTPLGNAALLRAAGARDAGELDWWQQASAGKFTVTLTPAQHFSARSPLDRNKALWGGFLISAGRHRVYFAGDSGYGPHFGDIGARGAIDLALLPIGAYEPRWFMQDIHMNPEEAVQAHLDLRAARSIAMHHGTFQLTPEPIDEPVHRLRAALVARGIPAGRFVAVEPGTSLSV